MMKVKNIVGEFHNLRYNTLSENNSNKLLEESKNNNAYNLTLIIDIYIVIYKYLFC